MSNNNDNIGDTSNRSNDQQQALRQPQMYSTSSPSMQMPYQSLPQQYNPLLSSSIPPDPQSFNNQHMLQTQHGASYSNMPSHAQSQQHQSQFLVQGLSLPLNYPVATPPTLPSSTTYDSRTPIYQTQHSYRPSNQSHDLSAGSVMHHSDVSANSQPPGSMPINSYGHMINNQNSSSVPAQNFPVQSPLSMATDHLSYPPNSNNNYNYVSYNQQHQHYQYQQPQQPHAPAPGFVSPAMPQQVSPLVSSFPPPNVSPSVATAPPTSSSSASQPPKTKTRRKNTKSSTNPPPRKRTTRACDQCNHLRTKCDGKQPCAHCIGMYKPFISTVITMR